MSPLLLQFLPSSCEKPRSFNLYYNQPTSFPRDRLRLLATSSKSFCHQEQYNHIMVQPHNYHEQYCAANQPNNKTSTLSHKTSDQQSYHTTHTTNYNSHYQLCRTIPNHPTNTNDTTIIQWHQFTGRSQMHSATVFGVVRNFLAGAQSCDMLSQCRLFLLQRGMRGKAWFPLPPSKTPPPVMRSVVSISIELKSTIITIVMRGKPCFPLLPPPRPH